MQAIYQGRPVRIDGTMVAAFAGVVVICGVATVVPLKVGLKKMEGFEF